MLTYFNTVRPKTDGSGRVTSRMLVGLSEANLAALNSKDAQVVVDPLRLGKVHLGLEDVRIFDVSVEHAELVDPPSEAVEVRVRIEHPDASILRKTATRYKFRNTARRWQTTVRHAREQTSILPEGDDPMDLSLLRHLLGEIDENAPLFHRPSVGQPLLIKRADGYAQQIPGPFQVAQP